MTQLNSIAALRAEDADRYRLRVVATDIADAVASIGGRIFDQAMAGWDVTVAVQGGSRGVIDDRPIQILGARAATLVADGAGRHSCPQVLAVATDLFVANEHLRRLAMAAHRGGATDVLLWGGRPAPTMNRRFGRSATGRAPQPRCSKRMPCRVRQPSPPSRPKRRSFR